MSPRYTDAQRMELRAEVRLAGDIVPTYWPIRTFVHHNPLHALEDLDFEDAVEEGRRWLGGRGYLPNAVYRQYVRQGRITLPDVDAALAGVSTPASVEINGRRVTHAEVLRAALVDGIPQPVADPDERDDMPTDGEGVERLAAHLLGAGVPRGDADPVHAAVAEALASIGRRVTLARWCDDTIGTALVAELDAEMIQWCAAYLDEGQAAWPMPDRERGLFLAWKSLVAHDGGTRLRGMAALRRIAAALPDDPHDAILETLAALEIDRECRRDYLALHLAAMPGWVAFIKWRAQQQGYDWQEAYPASLVKYLAVRLVYERVLVENACRAEMGFPGTVSAIRRFVSEHREAYCLRRARLGGRLSRSERRAVDRLAGSGAGADHREWKDLAARCLERMASPRIHAHVSALQLQALAEHLDLPLNSLLTAVPDDLERLLAWLAGFPEDRHGVVWLHALEAGYQRHLVEALATRLGSLESAGSSRPDTPVRPDAQAVFCIDVRSEVFRRHLEAVGNYETYGFAGFFICFIRYQAFGTRHYTDQFPVIMKAKQVVREIPRSYHSEALGRHQAGVRLLHAIHALLHDLKAHVITPYVMVESVGWFYAIPFFCKTLAPSAYARARAWLRQRVAPSVATTLTVDKLSKNDAEGMVASGQRAAVRRALRERFARSGEHVPADLLERLRRSALGEDDASSTDELARALDVSPVETAAFLESLRRDYRVDRRWSAAQRDRITQTGLTVDEQVFTVETALRMMGLTRNFARLVLFCAHGSRSENNPFEAALDCGACGGNEGSPNARLLAAMANKATVRERVAKSGIDIPADTYFVAGQIDTTTDEVQLLDLEDIPATHRKDVSRLLADLKEASELTSAERVAAFPGVPKPLAPAAAARHVRRRSADWSQVRPEWGLSGNAAFLIGRRRLTRGLDLGGRVFLHSYDHREDPSGRLLEILLTAPQVVTQWINMEHYFSTVDNDVYGSGSKMYHNVVGHIGVMLGTQSDLRTGLAEQTVMNGEMPYHEPIRLVTVVEAPRASVEKLIGRHEVLQRFYHHRWIHLMVIEPDEGILYRYDPTGGWHAVGASDATKETAAHD